MRIFEILGRTGGLKILIALFEGEKNYSDLEKLVKNPVTTSSRLSELKECGLIIRDVQPDKYRTVNYFLTEKGKKVAEYVSKIIELGD